MSDINLDFTVSNNQISFTVEPNEITITPDVVELTVATNVTLPANASQGNVLYYDNNTITGIPNVSYTAGNLSLGNIANVKITGGTNGYVLQTDGTGNLDWVAQSGGGTGTPGGSNTQIQFNDAGVFGGNAGFTFNKLTGDVNISGNTSVTGTITGNVVGNVLGSLTGLQFGVEKISIVSPVSGGYNFDVLSNAIQYSTTNSIGNVTPNFRGNSTISLNSLLGVGQSITSTYVMTNGPSTYNISNIQIDSTSQTVKWVNGLTPSGVANTTTAYTFTLIKTASTPTYTVLGSATRYA